MRRLLTLLLHDVYEGDPSKSRVSRADRYKLTLAELDGHVEELTAWNAKKVLERIFGAGHSRFAEWART